LITNDKGNWSPGETRIKQIPEAVALFCVDYFFFRGWKDFICKEEKKKTA
jgi:hypothetical protein